ncbi:HNH endonuclease [Rhodococcus wratislaviensis]|uniref:HNH endonuclease n=1 Tax=Rhodococcus wratislaviensis TaxID=44752 RepID=UPI0035152620
MIRAIQPVADDIANYRHVANERKREGRLRPDALAPKVLELYETYLVRVMDKDGPVADPSISDFDQDELEATAYFLKLAHFKILRTAILNAVYRSKCPYCYQFKATEIDHYLPKSKFGEYAVYAPNLVPICRTCNGKKLSRYMRLGGGRRFLHPYFDTLPTSPARYLTATLSVSSSVTITFELVQPPSMSDEIWEVLRNQFADLELGIRYVEEAVETMTSMLGSLHSHFDRGGAAEVTKQLQIERQSKEDMYGANHWWPVTLETLAKSQAFCNGGFKALESQKFPGL